MFELKDVFDKVEGITDHELNPFWPAVMIVGFVEFKTGVEYFIDCLNVLSRVTDSLLDDSGFVHQKLLIDVYSLRSQIVSISPEVIQLVHINACLFVRDKFELPYSLLSFWTTVYKLYDSFDLLLWNRAWDEVIVFNNVSEQDLTCFFMLPFFWL